MLILAITIAIAIVIATTIANVIVIDDVSSRDYRYQGHIESTLYI